VSNPKPLALVRLPYRRRSQPQEVLPRSPFWNSCGCPPSVVLLRISTQAGNLSGAACQSMQRLRRPASRLLGRARIGFAKMSLKGTTPGPGLFHTFDSANTPRLRFEESPRLATTSEAWGEVRFKILLI